MIRDEVDALLDGGGQFTTEPGYGDGAPGVCWACNLQPAGAGPSGACAPCRDRLLVEEPFESHGARPLVGGHYVSRGWARP